MSRIPPHHDPACWGCGDNPNGLHLPQPTQEGATEYEAYFSFDERHQGGPGIVHGGLVAGALDEAVGLLATWYAFPAVTARIFVRYRHPVAINPFSAPLQRQNPPCADGHLGSRFPHSDF